MVIVVARNHDDHSKNFGFLLDGFDYFVRQQGAAAGRPAWRLSPAFDIAYSYKPGSPWVDAHQLSLNGKREYFQRNDLLAVATLIGNFTREAPKIIEQVLAVVSQWPYYARQAGVFSALQEEVQGNLRLAI